MFLLGHGVLGYGILSIHWDMAYSVLDQWVTEHRKLGRGASGIEHFGVSTIGHEWDVGELG